MLVLSRRLEERIVIGNDIVITVVSVSGGGDRATVRIGIDAPRSLPVWRQEVLDEVRAEMARARLVEPGDAARVLNGLKRKGEQ